MGTAIALVVSHVLVGAVGFGFGMYYKAKAVAAVQKVAGKVS